MSHDQNTKLGRLVENWSEPATPVGVTLDGQFARLEPLDADQHAALLYKAYEGQDHVWDYLPYGPFSSAAQYHRWVREAAALEDTKFLAVYDKSRGIWGGVASYLRINPQMGSIEVGHINFSPSLQRTQTATEAIYLMIKWAFDAGYRRFEWKCNALNMASRRSAQRFGFSYEGIFRQAAVVKGRNRDTAWFAIIDSEWPALDAAFQAWFSASNFDENDQQIESLADLTRLVRVASDPDL